MKSLMCVVALLLMSCASIADAHGGFGRSRVVVRGGFGRSAVIVNRGFGFGRSAVIVNPYYAPQAVIVRQPVFAAPVYTQQFVAPLYGGQAIIGGGCSQFFSY